MTLYARINPDRGTVQAEDFAQAPPASKGWLLVTRNAAPVAGANQVADRSIVVGASTAVETWALRAKTQLERDVADDAADAAALKASTVITLLKAEIAGTSALTAAQFRVLAARVLLFLVRRAIGGG